MRHLTTTFLCLLLFGSCNPAGDASLPPDAVTERSAALDATDPAQAAARKVVRTGELLLRVDELETARASVLEATRAAGGHAAEDRLDDRGRVVHRVLRVRVPADRFEALVAAVERLGEVERFHVSADDVTAQWVDADARVRAKKQMESRYLELVARAKSVAEVLQVEKELGLVRAEIEAMESQLRSLGDQVALSTLAITLSARRSEHTAVAASEFTDALTTGWTALLRCLVGMLTVWPLLVVATIAFVVRRARRSRAPALPAAA